MRRFLAAAGLALSALLITAFFIAVFVLSGYLTWEDVLSRLSWELWTDEVIGCLVAAGTMLAVIAAGMFILKGMAASDTGDPKIPTVDDFNRTEDL